MAAWTVRSFTWRKSSYSTDNANCVEVGFQPVTWRKSSYSTDTSNCVEVGTGGPVVGVRDTKDRDSGTLVLASRPWAAFLSAIRG